jgi:hypothetical protein
MAFSSLKSDGAHAMRPCEVMCFFNVNELDEANLSTEEQT